MLLLIQERARQGLAKWISRQMKTISKLNHGRIFKELIHKSLEMKHHSHLGEIKEWCCLYRREQTGFREMNFQANEMKTISTSAKQTESRQNIQRIYSYELGNETSRHVQAFGGRRWARRCCWRRRRRRWCYMPLHSTVGKVETLPWKCSSDTTKHSRFDSRPLLCRLMMGREQSASPAKWQATLDIQSSHLWTINLKWIRVIDNSEIVDTRPLK